MRLFLKLLLGFFSFFIRHMPEHMSAKVTEVYGKGTGDQPSKAVWTCDLQFMVGEDCFT